MTTLFEAKVLEGWDPGTEETHPGEWQGLEWGGTLWSPTKAAVTDSRKSAIRSSSHLNKYAIVHHHGHQEPCDGVKCEIIMPDREWAGA